MVTYLLIGMLIGMIIGLAVGSLGIAVQFLRAEIRRLNREINFRK